MSALRNAAAVLRCFSPASRDLSVTGIASRLAIPKSTASRLLKMMREEGLLELHSDSRRYRPGALLFELGRSYRADSSLMELLSETIAEIVGQCGHTGYVSVLDGTDILALRMFPGHHMVRVVMPAGRRMPAFATAVGRALLARKSNAEVKALYHGRLNPPSASAPRSMDELLRRLDTVRLQRVAQADDEANRGAGTLAVALHDPETGETMAGCVSYSLAIMSERDRAEVRRLLLKGAAGIGAAVGDPVWNTAPGPDRNGLRPRRRRRDEARP